MQKTETEYAFPSGERIRFRSFKMPVVGDDERDLEAGQSAGCKTILVDAAWLLIKVVNERVIGA